MTQPLIHNCLIFLTVSFKRCGFELCDDDLCVEEWCLDDLDDLLELDLWLLLLWGL